MYPDVSESVIPTEAKRSGGILCLPLSSYGKATTRFLDSRRKASLARNDVHLSGYSISGSALAGKLGGADLGAAEPFRYRKFPVRFARLDQLSRDIMADNCGQVSGDSEQQVEINARVIAHLLKHVHRVFGADVAAGARRKRTATKPGRAKRRSAASRPQEQQPR